MDVARRRFSVAAGLLVKALQSGVLRLKNNRKQLGPGGDPRFAVPVFLMGFHGLYGDFQLTGEFFAGATAEHQTPDGAVAGDGVNRKCHAWALSRRDQAADGVWRIGSSTRKVVPTPNSLRTEMSPPCFFTMP